MATRKPLVLIGGQPQELPSGDSIGTVAAIASYYEPMVGSTSGNSDVVYQVGTNIVPDFVMSSDGDIMLGTGV